MRHWFTRADMQLAETTAKRFDPAHWTIDFPRGSMACVVSVPGSAELSAHLCFARAGDLAGLIFESEDRHVHVAHKRQHSCDYSRCTLRFRWQSSGLMPLDAVNGPTLTVEGRDAEGISRSWYVRLWNYADGTPEDALVELDFDALDAGFQLPNDAERISPKNIDRLFITMVPPAYESGSQVRFSEPVEASVRLSDIQCTGSGSVLPIKDAFVPEHQYRICTAYDDLYHLTPERVIDELERLGYRKLINHYVGMSHYPALGGDGMVVLSKPLNLPARRWHESFASIAETRGYTIIWSVSFELLEKFCPEQWKQRAWDGEPATTGYTPPSTLLSPANSEAVTYLGAVASEFASIGIAAGMAPHLQVGEPWWWVTSDDKLCIYDDAASARLGPHEPIKDVRSVTGEAQSTILEEAGHLLAEATLQIVGAVRDKVGELTSYVLPYLPSILREDAPELKRVNLPVGWTSPAFDFLQLEDYEWAAEDQVERSRRGLAYAVDRLGYRKQQCQYLAGFVPHTEQRAAWSSILRAAGRAHNEIADEVFVWALPQVLRDNLTIFRGEESVDSFRDVPFPLEIGAAAWVEPCFSTTVHEALSGHESRNANWAQARLRYDVGPGVRSLADLQDLLHFFRSVRGNAVAFRFRDPFDYCSATHGNEPSPGDCYLGEGDGTRRRFPLVKTYGEGEIRRITRPDVSSVLVAIDGASAAGWVLSEGGIIEFDNPPPARTTISAGFLFDVAVRFEEEQLRVGRKTYLAGQAVTVPLIEVKEA